MPESPLQDYRLLDCFQVQSSNTIVVTSMVTDAVRVSAIRDSDTSGLSPENSTRARALGVASGRDHR